MDTDTRIQSLMLTLPTREALAERIREIVAQAVREGHEEGLEEAAQIVRKWGVRSDRVADSYVQSIAFALEQRARELRKEEK